MILSDEHTIWGIWMIRGDRLCHLNCLWDPVTKEKIVFSQVSTYLLLLCCYYSLSVKETGLFVLLPSCQWLAQRQRLWARRLWIPHPINFDSYYFYQSRKTCFQLKIVEWQQILGGFDINFWIFGLFESRHLKTF